MVKVTEKDILDSTTRTGCVDLNRIRNMCKERSKKRKASIKNINERKMEIVTIFQEAYKEIIGGSFKLRSKSSFRTWTDKNGKKYVKKEATDKQRLWEAYQYASAQHGIDTADMGAYFNSSIEDCSMRYKVVSPRQIFGFAINRGVIDEWFFKISKQRLFDREKDKIEARAKSHAELFDR